MPQHSMLPSDPRPYVGLRLSFVDLTPMLDPSIQVWMATQDLDEPWQTRQVIHANRGLDLLPSVAADVVGSWLYGPRRDPLVAMQQAGRDIRRHEESINDVR